MRELSKRAGQDKRHVIVKLMVNHFRKVNLVYPYPIISSDKWERYNLPAPEELPSISLEVNTNYRLIMGLFHTKFLVVDRKSALLNSNNIYDRPNLEMMVHYERDVVNSFYDIFLISWAVSFKPDLVCLRDEAPVSQDFNFGSGNITLNFMIPSLDHHHSNVEDNPSAADFGQRKTSDNTTSNKVLKFLVDNETSYSLSMLVETTTEIIGNIGQDMSSRFQHPLTTHLNTFSASTLMETNGSNLSPLELEKLSADFIPFIFHPSHQPFPIAFVNRAAHRAPDRLDRVNPQNAAWLGAFRYAEKSLFIQSPNFNASLAIDGVITAEKYLEVYWYTAKGE